MQRDVEVPEEAVTELRCSTSPSEADPRSSREIRAVMGAGRFRKKPVVIDAIKFDGGNHHDVAAFMGCRCGLGNPQPGGCYYAHSNAGPRAVFIRTLEGDRRIDRGDRIIRGVAGEFYPCKPDIFEATYEPAGEEAGER